MNALLEHGHLWLRGRADHASFWDFPMFSPARNVTAYTETLLAAVPLYAPGRWLGLSREAAFQTWLLLAAALGYLAMLGFLRRGLGFSLAGSAAGAYLFAFGAPRVARLGHPQLLPHFFAAAGLLGLALLARPEASRALRWGAAALFCAGFALQLYAGFYLGWLSGFALLLAGLLALAVPSARARLVPMLRQNAVPLAAGALLAGALLAPLAVRSLAAARDVGLRPYAQVVPMLPSPVSWLYPGPGSLLYGRLAGAAPYRELPYAWEKVAGIGLVTLAASLAGLWRIRRMPLGRVCLLVGTALLLLTTDFGGGASLWRTVAGVVPGGAAIRAVSRVALVLLVPAAIGLAAWLEGRSRRAVAVLVPLMALEQTYAPATHSRTAAREDVARVVAAVPPTCGSFYVIADGPGAGPSLVRQMDAVLAQLETGIPTVNGYSGNLPPGYGSLHENVARDPADFDRIRSELVAWELRNGLRAGSVCRVFLSYP